MNHKTWFNLLVSAAVLMVLAGSVAVSAKMLRQGIHRRILKHIHQ